MSRQPILILTATAGAGHNMAARALHEAFSLIAPDQPVELHDVLDLCPRPFRLLYSQGYAQLISHSPRLMGWVYDTIDQSRGGPVDWKRKFLQKVNSGGFVRYLRRTQPSLIINTQFLPAEIVAGELRRGRLNCPQWTVLTDFEAFRLWIQNPTERYYVSTAIAGEYLRAKGVPADAIRRSGIPIRPVFAEPLDRMEMRARHALVQDRPVVLMSCGRGGRRPEWVADALQGIRPDAQIVLIAGRNERLRARLEKKFGRLAPRVRVLGHTDRMNEWMHAADLLISKPGGLVSSEALACRLPLVIVDPIPGQETRNSDYLLEHGAAIKVNDLHLLAQRVNNLLADPKALSALREAAARIARPQAAHEIVNDALARVGVQPSGEPAPVSALSSW